MIKVGILYPKSNTHAGLAIDYLDGLDAFLRIYDLKQKIQLVTESIGFGGGEKEVYDKLEKQLLLDRVDILFAWLDLRVLELAQPLIQASGRLVVIVNPGSNIPTNWLAGPNIAYLTLHHSFLCHLTANQAAVSGNGNGLVATSFYEAGYLHVASMTNQFFRQGGIITYNFVHNQTRDQPYSIDNLLNFLQGNPDTRNLLCIYDEKPAADFYQALAKSNEASECKLFVSPMMLEPQALIPAPYPFSIFGHIPWNISLNNDSNKIFNEEMVSLYHRAPNIFSLLGWETGAILREILQVAGDNYTFGTGLVESLLHRYFASPRGEMHLDEETHYFMTPAYGIQLDAGSSSPQIMPVTDLTTHWKNFTSFPQTGTTSGWTNTYLCY